MLLSSPVVLAVLVVLGGLALVGWLGTRPSGRGPAPVAVDETTAVTAARDAAAVIAVALERANGVAGLGRHDERRCAY